MASAYDIPIASDSESLEKFAIPFHTSAPVPFAHDAIESGEKFWSGPREYKVPTSAAEFNRETQERKDKKLQNTGDVARDFNGYSEKEERDQRNDEVYKSYKKSLEHQPEIAKMPEIKKPHEVVEDDLSHRFFMSAEKDDHDQAPSNLGSGHKNLGQAQKTADFYGRKAHELVTANRGPSGATDNGPTGKRFTESLHERKNDGKFEPSSNKRRKDKDDD